MDPVETPTTPTSLPDLPEPGHFVPNFEQAQEPEDLRLVAVKAPFDKRVPLPADTVIIELSDDEDRPQEDISTTPVDIKEEPADYKDIDWDAELSKKEELPSLPLLFAAATRKLDWNDFRTSPTPEDHRDPSSDIEEQPDQDDIDEQLNFVHKMNHPTTPTTFEDEEPITSAPSSSKKPRSTVVQEDEEKEGEEPHYHLEGLLALSSKKKTNGDFAREFHGFVTKNPIPSGFVDTLNGQEILQTIEDPEGDFDCSLTATPVDYYDGREKISYDFNLSIVTDHALSPYAFLMKLVSLINHRTKIIHEKPLGIRGAKLEGTSVKEIRKASKERFERENQRKRDLSSSEESEIEEEDRKGKKKAKRQD